MNKEYVAQLAKQIIEKTNTIANTCSLYSVLILWISELNTLERNVAYFEDFMEASLFMTTYEEYYVEQNKTFSIYINGQLIKSHSAE